ncbi:MAG TPA: hypothetical protein VGM90_09270 [Kofleriaceae bacterium]
MKRSALLVLALAACGPGDGGRPDAQIDGATLAGRVWAPDQGPGQVPPGQEVPISGARVYLAPERPADLPDHVYCDSCQAAPGSSILSGADGRFRLDAAPGHYWFVIEKGQFRVEREIEILPGVTLLPDADTTLPTSWTPSLGIFAPKLALAKGNNDRIEDILHKLGLMQLDVFDYDLPSDDPMSVATLLRDIDTMRHYHVIFFPCRGVMPPDVAALLEDEAVLTNIRTFVNEGGKLYVTDWSGEVADRAFPHQIELGDEGADSEGTYDPTALTGTLSTIGDADGDQYDVIDAKAIDPDLSAWLGLQGAPLENGSVVGMIDADAFEVVDLWNWIKKLNPVAIGTDGQGMPLYDTPKVWLTGSRPGTSGGPKPIAVTYQPTGCGKVLYTPFQTATATHNGLYPQERVLLYLILEIGSCSDVSVE